MKDVYDTVTRQIFRVREIISDRYNMKMDAPTLTYRIPNANGEVQRAMELGINIGWIEGLEYIKDWLDTNDKDKV